MIVLQSKARFFNHAGTHLVWRDEMSANRSKPTKAMLAYQAEIRSGRTLETRIVQREAR